MFLDNDTGEAKSLSFGLISFFISCAGTLLLPLLLCVVVILEAQGLFYVYLDSLGYEEFGKLVLVVFVTAFTVSFIGFCFGLISVFRKHKPAIFAYIGLFLSITTMVFIVGIIIVALVKEGVV